jgi:hypothetical protein
MKDAISLVLRALKKKATHHVTMKLLRTAALPRHQDSELSGLKVQRCALSAER